MTGMPIVFEIARRDILVVVDDATRTTVRSGRIAFDERDVRVDASQRRQAGHRGRVDHARGGAQIADQPLIESGSC